MNHYSKLSVMIIRLVGVLSFLVGFMGLVYGVLAGTLLSTNNPEYTLRSARLVSAGIFILVGVIVYLLGKPIGRIVGRGIGE